MKKDLGVAIYDKEIGVFVYLFVDGILGIVECKYMMVLTYGF